MHNPAYRKKTVHLNTTNKMLNEIIKAAEIYPTCFMMYL